MSIFNKAFAYLTIDDVRSLIPNQVTEGQNLEFKKEVWGRSDEDIREMLRDISSIANAYGGLVIVGMEEESDTGKALTLHEVPNVEDERDRIFASCLANLQPRIIGLEIRTLEINSGEKILLIKIPDSFNLHQIIFKSLYQFWIRHDRQKSKMSYNEIRDALIKNYVGTEAVLNLLEKRRQAERAGGVPKMILNAIPLRLENELFNVSDSKLRQILGAPSDRNGGWGFNFHYSTVHPSLNGLKIGADYEGKFLELYEGSAYFAESPSCGRLL